MAYAIIFREQDAAVHQLQVADNFGFALQAGAEYRLSDRWELYADYKRAWLSVDAKGFLSNAAAVRAAVKLNPDLVSAGVKFRLD